MKKYLIFIPVIVILLIALIISIAMHIDSFEVMTIPRSYSYVSTISDSDEMDVLVYVSSKNSYITRTSGIKNAYIKNNKNTDEVQIKILDITDCDVKTKVYGHTFYLYEFSFDITFPTTSEYELAINDALLILEYDTKDVTLELGSFYYYKTPYYGDNSNNLIVTSLKPVLGYLDENRTVSGIRIGLRNNSNQKIIICDIKLLDPNIYASLGEIKIIEEDINGLETMSSILGYNYYLKTKEKDDATINLEIDKKDEYDFIIPIKYLEDYPINSFGFIISYKEENSDVIVKYYYDDFIFFNSMKETYDETKIKIATYENN